MGEYLIPIFVSCAALAAISYVSYPGASERAVKIAAGVLLLYTVISPVAVLIGELSEIDPEEIFSELDDMGKPSGGEYEEVTKEALADGIRRLISSEYGLDGEDITVTVFDLDFEAMRAGRIKVILSGGAAAADYRGIRSYINGLGLGECEVKVELGK